MNEYNCEECSNKIPLIDENDEILTYLSEEDLTDEEGYDCLVLVYMKGYKDFKDLPVAS